MQSTEGDLSFDELKNDVRALRESMAALNVEINQLRSATPPRGLRIFSKLGLRRWLVAAGISALALTAWAESKDIALVIDRVSGNVKIAEALDVVKGLTVGQRANMKDSLDVANGLDVGQDVKINGSLNVVKEATVNGKLGIGTPTPEAKLDLGGNNAKGLQAILARGSDANFRLTVQNGDGGNQPGNEVARLGMEYNKPELWYSGFRFFRGNGGDDIALGVYTKGERRILVTAEGTVEIGAKDHESALDVKGEMRGRPWVSDSYT